MGGDITASEAMGVRPRLSSADEPEDEREHDRNDEAGHQREVESAALGLYADVARSGLIAASASAAGRGGRAFPATAGAVAAARVGGGRQRRRRAWTASRWR